MTARSHIGIIGTVGVPASYGGFETLVHQLIMQLGDRENLTVYCCKSHYKPTERSEFWNGSRRVYIPLKANGISSIIYDLVSFAHAVFFCNVLVVLGVSAGVFFPLIKLFPRKRLIVNIDGLEWRRNKWGKLAKWYLKLAERMAVWAADEVIADNDAIKAYVEETYAKGATMIPYGGDHVKPVSPRAEDHLTYPFLHRRYAIKVCRIEPENNVEDVLKAFSGFTDFPLVIVGNWAHSAYGKALFEKYSRHHNIYLLPPIYDPAQINLLRSHAYVYVHGHEAGGTNPSLVEAMSLGLPVIAKDVIFNRNTTANEAWFFQDTSDLLNLLDAMKMDTAFQLGKKMSRIAETRYTWATIAEAYAHLWAAEEVQEVMPALKSPVPNY